MTWVSTAAWALVFLVPPLALWIAATWAWGGNILVVFLALSWLVLGAVLYPFAHLGRAA